MNNLHFRASNFVSSSIYLFCLDFLPSVSFCVLQRNENNTHLKFWSELFIYCSLLLSSFLYHVFETGFELCRSLNDAAWILHTKWASFKRRSALLLVLLVTRLYNVPPLVYPQLKLCEAASRSFLPAARGLLPPQQPCVVLSPATGKHHDGEHAHTYPSYTGHSPGL